uniref:YqaJ viral recombinase family protein n=1 Tax=Shewanella sp. TaxID=50422 RepID=UPI0035616A60
MINQLRERIASHQTQLGFDPLTVEQGSYQWHTMRLGVISASRCKDLMAKKGSQTRNTYMMELISEIATGAPAEMVSAKAMEWGTENEPKARQAFEFMTGEVVHELPFIY